MTRNIYLTILLNFLFFTVTAHATFENQSKEKEILATYGKGDQAFRERHKKERAFEALKIYQDLYTKNPNDPEAGWRMAMACYFIGIRHTDDAEQKKRYYSQGKEAGLKSIRNSRVRPKRRRRIWEKKEDARPESNCAACYFWTAVNTALYGQTVGIVETLFLLSDIKKYLRFSSKIDPSYAYAGAFRTLGVIEQKVPGILGGSTSRAKKYLTEAVKLAPDEPLNYLFLARLLREEFEEFDEALRVAKQGLAVRGLGPERLESRDAQTKLKEFISQPR